MADTGTAIISGKGYTVTIYTTGIAHTLDKDLVELPIPQKGKSDTLTYLIDLRKCKEALTITGFLLDTSTTSGLTQKGYLIDICRKTAAKFTLTWGEGGTYETMTGNIKNVDIKEETGRLTGDSQGSEKKRYKIQ